MATSAADVARTVPPAAPAPTAAVVSPPKPPISTDGIVRFMATAIWLVNSVPDAPTIIPATINDVLFSATPVAAADRPVNALRVEITTGMSAPPIGNTKKLPTSAAETSSSSIQNSPSAPATIAAPQPTATASSSPLTSVWAGPNGLIGLPLISSCNLANAMFDPQN